MEISDFKHLLIASAWIILVAINVSTFATGRPCEWGLGAIADVSVPSFVASPFVHTRRIDHAFRRSQVARRLDGACRKEVKQNVSQDKKNTTALSSSSSYNIRLRISSLSKKWYSLEKKVIFGGQIKSLSETNLFGVSLTLLQQLDYIYNCICRHSLLPQLACKIYRMKAR